MQFNIIVDETEILADHLLQWKRPDLSENRPPPLVIEIYIDTSDLGPGQALVLVDEAGKRWDVADALSSASGSPAPATKDGGKYCEVVLERWTIQLDDAQGSTTSEPYDQLPNVYKKGVVLFRSLYTYLRFMATWKLYRRLGRQQGNPPALKLKFRIRQARSLARPENFDSLAVPLCPSEINTNTAARSNTTTATEARHGHIPARTTFEPLRKCNAR